jgi:uncharacterized protein
MSDTVDRLRERVDATVFIDTHEHLPDESSRLAGRVGHLRCADWTTLLTHYVCDDLACCGLSRDVDQRFFDESGDPAAKFRLIERHWRRMRHTGFGQSLRRTLRLLYAEDDLTEKSVPRIAEKYADLVRPGLYDHVLRRVARIDQCHVNSIESPVFHQTNMPGLLRQDINVSPLVNPFGNPESASRFGDRMGTSDDWLALIDQAFAQHAPSAVAVKSTNAYFRSLDYVPSDRARVDRIFREAQPTAWGNYTWASADDARQVDNFMLRHALKRAGEHRLPFKFHTGYHAGIGRMPLAEVARNASDIGELARDFPDTRIVCFHIGYPYQNEFIALAKQHPNVYVDMCWAWILDPVASVDFLQRFLVAAPVHKVLCFGGDFVPVELVAGHAEMARAGIAQALAHLVEGGWIAEAETPELIERLMRGNAIELFGEPAAGV